MAKFNEVLKCRRAQTADRKRQIHGDPGSKKLKIRPQPNPLSGKRKRKLLKKWRRDQKEAIEKGLVSMEDIEMAVAEDKPQGSNKNSKKIHLKKSLKVKQLKGKGKKKKSSATVEAAPDAMVE